MSIAITKQDPFDTGITASVIADSYAEFASSAHRITTLEVVMPRFILAELNTHRVFSRNSASSRAIPFDKMVEIVANKPFVPVAFQDNHKGMQGTIYLEGVNAHQAKAAWLTASEEAVYRAQVMHRTGATKQLCNRLLEPFMWHKVLVTSTEWENFFDLRCPEYVIPEEYDTVEIRSKSRREVLEILLSCADGLEENDPEKALYLSVYEELSQWVLLDWLKINQGKAEIHMGLVAEAIYDALDQSSPRKLEPGEWHAPYTEILVDGDGIETCVAQCARTSYSLAGSSRAIDAEADARLFNSLSENGHWSPFEHCARAMTEHEYNAYSRGWCRNFRGFIQLREQYDIRNKH